ncbi:MAG: polymer-forming cytoskeletal protein [Bacteroidales bacterium]|nr:polymer-forming cytoskeletal protein [Bacteroidales bacterium]
MAKNNIMDTKPNTIVSGTVIKGEITTNGDFRIDGKLVGSIVCKGKIVVGQTGSIDGEIECQNADFSGNIKAKVHVEQLLSLKSTAVFHGDIVTNKISIEPGAKFSGTCNMDGGSHKPEPINATRFAERQKEKIPG